jgi:hypothetical protein
MMTFRHPLRLKLGHRRWLLRLLCMAGVLFLQSHAFAAIFAPVCDPSATTMPVAAPPTEGDGGEIDVWSCGDSPFSARQPTFSSAPWRGEGEIASATAGTLVAPAWRARFPIRPMQKRLIWDEGGKAPLPNGYATGPFRPPRLTNLP